MTSSELQVGCGLSLSSEVLSSTGGWGRCIKPIQAAFSLLFIIERDNKVFLWTRDERDKIVIVRAKSDTYV